MPASEVRQRAVVCAVEVGQGERLGRILEQVMTATEDLYRATSVLARVLAGLASGVLGSQPQAQNEVRRTPTPRECRAAYRLMLFWGQREVRLKLSEGKLAGLGA